MFNIGRLKIERFIFYHKCANRVCDGIKLIINIWTIASLAKNFAIKKFILIRRYRKRDTRKKSCASVVYGPTILFTITQVKINIAAVNTNYLCM